MVKLLLVAGVPLGVLAQEATGGDLPSWLQWGVLGLVIVGFVTRQLVPGWLYADCRTENREQRAEIARLVQLTLDTQAKTLPAIEASTSAVSEALGAVRALQRGP